MFKINLSTTKKKGLSTLAFINNVQSIKATKYLTIKIIFFTKQNIQVVNTKKKLKNKNKIFWLLTC